LKSLSLQTKDGRHPFRGSGAGRLGVARGASVKQSWKMGSETRLITEYQDTYKTGMEGLEDGGSKHTVRVDHQGRVWGTAVFNNLTVFDPGQMNFRIFQMHILLTVWK